MKKYKAVWRDMVADFFVSQSLKGGGEERLFGNLEQKTTQSFGR
jgi:hypothetical protein